MLLKGRVRLVHPLQDGGSARINLVFKCVVSKKRSVDLAVKLPLDDTSHLIKSWLLMDVTVPGNARTTYAHV